MSVVVNAADLSERGGVGVYLYAMMACENWLFQQETT